MGDLEERMAAMERQMSQLTMSDMTIIRRLKLLEKHYDSMHSAMFSGYAGTLWRRIKLWFTAVRRKLCTENSECASIVKDQKSSG